MNKNLTNQNKAIYAKVMVDCTYSNKVIIKDFKKTEKENKIKNNNYSIFCAWAA